PGGAQTHQENLPAKGVGVGEPLGQSDEDAQGLLPSADGEPAGVGDDWPAVASDVELLPPDLAPANGSFRYANQNREPPHASKRLDKHSLASARGSPFQRPVRNPG